MNAKKWSRAASLLCILLIAFLAACGEDEANGNNNDTQTDTGVTEDVSQGEDTEPGVQADYRSEYQLRLTSFAFTAGSPGTALNGVLKQNFDQDKNYPVIVLIEMAELDVETESVSVRGGSGIKTETPGVYNWDPDTDLQALAPGKIDADGVLDVMLPALDFVATFEGDDGPVKTVIPIKGLKLNGTLKAKADGSEPTIDDGILEGYVTEEDGNNTKVLVPNLGELVLASVFGGEGNLNHDVDGDGTNDAWLLTASYTAIETSIVD